MHQPQPVFKFKDYPFNWQEFYEWKNNENRSNTLHYRDFGNGVVVLYARSVV